MHTKTQLRKMKKAMLLDMLREAYPWKSTWWYNNQTKEEIIDKLIEDKKTWTE